MTVKPKQFAGGTSPAHGELRRGVDGQRPRRLSEPRRDDLASPLMAALLLGFWSWLYDLNLRALYTGKCDGGIGNGSRRGTRR